LEAKVVAAVDMVPPVATDHILAQMLLIMSEVAMVVRQMPQVKVLPAQHQDKLLVEQVVKQ
jgi:hypothetical protein